MSLISPTAASKNYFQTIIARQFGNNVHIKYVDSNKSDSFQSHVVLVLTTDNDKIIHEYQPGVLEA